MRSQTSKLLKALRQRPMTKRQILRLGILNGGGRVFDLRELGYDIGTHMIRVRKGNGEYARVAQYVLNG